MGTLIALLITLIIWSLIFYLIWWGINYIGIPEPFNKVVRVIMVVLVLIVVIGLLTGYVGTFPFLRT